MRSKTIAIIPARGGSKRLPEKNIKFLGGIPLLVHSIHYAKKHDLIEEVYVSTDDSDIKKIAINAGAKVIDRPNAISGDFEPTVSAIKHVLGAIEHEVERVVLLQPTNPLRPQGLLEEAIRIFEEKNCEVLFTVSQNYHKLGKINNERFVPFNYEPGQRSQDLEPLYFENGLLYIIASHLILQDKIITDDAFPMIVNHPFASVDIDTAEDFKYAEYLYNTSTNG